MVRSIGENIQTAVLKYGPNKVRSVRKTKVRIFSSVDRINWSIRALLYYMAIMKDHRPTPSLNSGLNKSVSSLIAAVRREIFFQFFISLKVKLSFKR